MRDAVNFKRQEALEKENWTITVHFWIFFQLAYLFHVPQSPGHWHYHNYWRNTFMATNTDIFPDFDDSFDPNIIYTPRVLSV